MIASVSNERGAGSLDGGQALYRFMVHPFPLDHFTVHSFRGKEALSGLYSFDVVATAPEDAAGAIERRALGQRALLLLRAGRASRVFHGVVAAIRQEGARGAHGVSQYRIRLVPRLWLLKHRRRSRIFQGKRVDEILAEVLKEAGIESRFNLQRMYAAREYCTQYEETDYRFLRRLAAESGFFFRYSQRGKAVEEALAAASAVGVRPPGTPLGARERGVLAELFSGETILFADHAGAYAPIDDGNPVGTAIAAFAAAGPTADVGGASIAVELPSPTLYYLSIQGTSTAAFDKVTRFEPERRVRTTAATHREYDPERPMTMLTAAEKNAPVDSLGGELAGPELEYFEHHSPFLFPKWRDASQEPPLILRQMRRDAHVAEGESFCPALGVGHRFRLEDHPVHDVNGEYAVTAVEHEGAASPQGQRDVYRNRFSCVPASVVSCPPRPKRRSATVALTATVVGPPDVEIHTDRMGQIKVQFHWDREGQSNEHSSCWVRTMQTWGGAGWGTQFIPRVGMEVVVTFEGGDPDKPMVLGCMYNGTHPPSFRLPEDKTRSGIRTQSSPGRGGFNELSFEDKKDQEQIYLRAQRDLDEVVERNHTLHVRVDEAIRVERDRDDAIGRDALLRVGGSVDERIAKDHATQVSGNRIDVTSGNVDTRVSGDRVARVEGQERREVSGDANFAYMGDLTTRVQGCHTIVVGHHEAQRSLAVHVEGVTSLSSTGTTEIRTDKELILRCGKSSIRITEGGIEFEAPSLRVKGGSSKLSVSEDGLQMASEHAYAQIMGDAILLKTDAGASFMMRNEVKVDGAQILLNSPEKAKDPPVTEPEPPTLIELVDKEGHPLAYQRYVLTLDDGTEIGGVTDKDGKAMVGVKAPGKISFPELRGVEEA
ncbi:type VI secretion system Vgr family protein [Polyangium sorediatum]|uniref:Type VI secretion system tip protein TssI/VgrG n=1 Tax=Polyangium sorediatum TaxID=889274 RepID=A0ABT6NK39_9BACT|nr:type VI secretion system tip protein TssI/VgrG [Polyangium sorediatum]MDI1428676.1 type VI secretion system tip protein TssI/VgrG [Polyangium sorediatum]